MIPNAPKIDAEPPSIDRCKDQLRQPMSPEDRSIRRAGWELFGSVQNYESTSVIMAMSGVDGMCRPLGYQGFIFVEGQLAGTISPKPMNSRTDAEIDRIFLTNANSLFVEFKRYSKTDPLCCPSGMNRVSFKIEPKEAKPLLIPLNVTTKN
ncbi:conserved hypothetical protein [Rippkaea orientalis PCC 8801]|uniref:Uncharacterized protein n=1 Tax=Rippkaea orientalis (strain PCC 8801 / RF-1) TaxID=41431 RepID=B7K328_RIPO1|nr:LppP/LprE family lipoprotein [Rippkaea orientalis]ACK67729.1 conserved hypothetical protein [Rippkaea orientalis PCC 8801]